MEYIINAIILGIIEGLTEFLPVSSTGHLIIAENLLHFTNDLSKVFSIVIQAGAILAVVILYRVEFLGLLKSSKRNQFAGFNGFWLLFLTSLPASLLGLFFHSSIKNYLFKPVPVALSLIVGSILIFGLESFAVKRRSKFRTLDDITSSTALGIGLFQCLALWPGFSRSLATIAGGIFLGARRELAAKYSFIAAVPIMFAATGYDLFKNRHILSAEYIGILSIGFVVSFIVAWVAIKLFIVLIQHVSFKPFAYYRLFLATIVLIYFW